VLAQRRLEDLYVALAASGNNRFFPSREGQIRVVHLHHEGHGLDASAGGGLVRGGLVLDGCSRGRLRMAGGTWLDGEGPPEAWTGVAPVGAASVRRWRWSPGRSRSTQVGQLGLRFWSVRDGLPAASSPARLRGGGLPSLRLCLPTGPRPGAPNISNASGSCQYAIAHVKTPRAIHVSEYQRRARYVTSTTRGWWVDSRSTG